MRVDGFTTSATGRRIKSLVICRSIRYWTQNNLQESFQFKKGTNMSVHNWTTQSISIAPHFPQACCGTATCIHVIQGTRVVPGPFIRPPLDYPHPLPRVLLTRLYSQCRGSLSPPSNNRQPLRRPHLITRGWFGEPLTPPAAGRRERLGCTDTGVGPSGWCGVALMSWDSRWLPISIDR